jgi:SAM-dependent methyltransferase
MLQHARRRIRQLAGSVPENILLLQGDLSDLPFRPDRFATILCLNVLHQIADAARLIPNLNALLTSDGHLYLTSLVSNSRFVGDHYLSVLYKTGEFVRPRSSVELKRLLSDSLGAGVNFETKGNMAFATTAPFTASSEAEIL